MSPVKAKPVEERFWPKVDKSEGCWNWTASKNEYGYGVFKCNGKLHKAHRIAWELCSGPIPDGMFIDHMCHNRSCVNPNHIRLATHKQNQENLKGAGSDNFNSGVRGVYRTRGGRWQARVTHNKTRYTAGTHDTIQQAEAAVIALRNQLFTHNDRDRQQQQAS